MVFEISAPVFIFFLVGIVLWLIGISFLLFKALANYNRLTKGISEKTLSEVLNNFLEQEKFTQKQQNKVLDELQSLRQESLKFIQKVGLVRFNPFSDTGGDQSFVLALLDGESSGLVITALYARTGTRWYVKSIKKGKALEYELSKEEKEAIKKVSKL